GSAGAGAGHAVLRALAEPAEGDRLQRLGDRGDRGQHVDAVLVVLHYARDAADLTLDAPQSLQVAVLVLGVSMHNPRIPGGGIAGWDSLCLGVVITFLDTVIWPMLDCRRVERIDMAQGTVTWFNSE